MTSRTMDQELGDRIRALRDQRGLTQAAFGEAIGVEQSTVSRIEDGKRPLTARELALTSNVLGATIGQLLDQETAAPALLRAADSDGEAIRESLRVFSACIDEYRGVEVLSG